MGNEQHSAAMLVDVPVGASPAGEACSVGTVVMPDNGKGDRPAESAGLKSPLAGGKPSQIRQEASKSTGRSDSESVKPRKDFPSEDG